MLADIHRLEHAARLAMGSLEGYDPVQRTSNLTPAIWALALCVIMAASLSGAWLL